MSFQQLNLIDPILKALQAEGYTQPTPIQAQSIPIILQKKDLLGCAQTGTGKTAAFSIPTLQLLYEQRQQHREQKTIKALILTPTRELAIQIGESLSAYGKHTGLKHLVIFGGVSQNPQTDALKKGVDILVATPGRLLDLMNQRFIHLDHIQMLILDEADRMLDMGFVHDVKKIIAKVPAKRQTLFFSATMPKEIQQLADSILNKPERVEVTPVSSTAETIQQEMYFVAKGDKKSLLNFVLQDKTIVTALVFTRTKHGADKVVKDLNKVGITAEAIHGNKSQNARQRALNNFKAHTTRVLVATDIAARGIDIDELAFVINYELPNIPETYVHRIGRTGRAGASGKAISFCDEEEKDFLKDIEKLIGVKVAVNDSHPYPLAQLTREQRILQDLKKQPHHNKPSSAEKQRNNKRRNNSNRVGAGKGKGGGSGMSGARPGGNKRG
ncbi:DEAD/DEAH box helicase [Mucilaginibacter sp. UR6-1]|uniref:DEAD/DEAH box helicase n=1 Tax=Mucilaginibacter sp. UR6-1 TaxID=1435643 RepID=UPI001E5D6C17|nr:DEAD/DEAH box helicase [Mucilaginibacter sp. UR6-1]MCC8408750.1 DEAD/DEAH box helicase [Mucilaginibacter sp. UR6-1]